MDLPKHEEDIDPGLTISLILRLSVGGDYIKMFELKAGEIIRGGFIEFVRRLESMVKCPDHCCVALNDTGRLLSPAFTSAGA
ncbi:hypothetical protein [Sphingobacterium sp.]|uniref:hypothetical protein n=1 Tax=Sphingobacterium sp. TaxID=341027 RepID=UPI0031DA2516